MYLFLTAAALSMHAASEPSTPGEVSPTSDRGTPSAFFWGDFDADGLADAFVVGEGPARLLSNLGDGRFSDVTDRSGLTQATLGARPHMGLWADYDGDGRLDLYLASRSGASQLLRQTDVGTFEVATGHAGLPEELGVSGAEWLDYDADGRPDLRVVSAGVERLFHNEDRGLFAEVELGIQPRPDLGAPLAGAGLDAVPSADRAAAGAGAGSGSASASGSGREAGTAGLPGSSAAAGPDAALFCAPSIRDMATGQCTQASSIPTPGMLYPLGNEFFIDGSGYVGLSTLTPGAKLDVVGGDIRTTGQLVSTAGSGAPLSVASSDLVPNLNADRLDGFDAAAFSMLGNSIGTAELEDDAVNGDKLAPNSVQSIHVFPNSLNSLDLASGAVLSDEIGDGTILDVDVNPLAAIAGTKISADFGTQTVGSSGTSTAPAVRGAGINGPSNGYLGVQGQIDFDGVAEADWGGEEIGVAGISTGASTSDNYGVAGLATHVGVRGAATATGLAGVLGENASTSGLAFGVMGEMIDPTSTGSGVRGVAPFYGVTGEVTDSGVGMLGLTITGTGGVGVYGRGNTGVLGDCQDATGSGWGVFGTTLASGGRGVYARAASSTGTNFGLYAESESTSGRAVFGIAEATSGVTYGVWGQAESTSGRGVRGEALATTGTNYGVQGRTWSPSGWGIISYGSSGTTGQKNFIQPHPTDPSKELHFFSLEGNESGTYFRGTDYVVGGVAVIPVPEDFRLVSSPEGLSVQLTPIGAPALLWVESRDLQHIVVRCDADVEFDYTVNGVRRGFEVVEVMADNHSFVPEQLGVPYGTQYPEAYRQILVENGILNPDFTPNEATAAALGWQLEAPAPEPAEPLTSDGIERARQFEFPRPAAPAEPFERD